MAEEETEEGATEAAAAPAAAGGSKIATIASLVNMVATLGVLGVLVISFQKEKSKPTVDDIVEGQAHKGRATAAVKGGEHGGGGHGEPAKGDNNGAGDTGKIISLDQFTVNLSSGVGTTPRYVRMNISVELEHGVPDQEFNVKTPRIRDTIINLLNSKKATEINAPDGREKLKEQIAREINRYMIQSKVKGVYFTNFAISQ